MKYWIYGRFLKFLFLKPSERANPLERRGRKVIVLNLVRGMDWRIAEQGGAYQHSGYQGITGSHEQLRVRVANVALGCWYS